MFNTSPFYSFFFLLLLSISCTKSDKSKILGENETNNFSFPNNTPGKYVVLDKSNMTHYKLSERDLQNIQFYLNDSIHVDLYLIDTKELKKIVDGVLVPVDSVITSIKQIKISKFTPCTIIGRKSIIKDGYPSTTSYLIADFGDNILLEYRLDPGFNRFQSVYSYNGTETYNNRAIFRKNSNIIFKVDTSFISSDVDVKDVIPSGKKKNVK